MKILLISNMYPSKDYPSYGIFVKNFENQLIEENFKFEKAIIRGKNKNKLVKLIKYFIFFVDVFKAIHKNNFDLIYVHYIGHSLLPLLIIEKNIKKPLIINAHGTDIFSDSKIKIFIQKIVTPIIKKADMVIVPSRYFEDIMEKKFNISKNKIFISPSGGINRSIFRPLKTSIDNQIFTIGYVSRIDEGKGWDTLLSAISLLVNKNIKNFKVILIGEGSQEKLLSKKIIELNLKDYVEYLGSIPHETLVNFYNQMNIFIFPTKLAESLGLVGLEAMACGVPVIGSNIGGLKGYINSGYNGEFFVPSDIEELSEKINYFMNLDEAELNNYKRGALETVKEYDSKIVAKNLTYKLMEFKNAK